MSYNAGNMPRFDLQTLTEYSDDAIVAELRRVADGLNGERLTIDLFNSRARVLRPFVLDWLLVGRA
jgi:hypothetical protein